MFTLIAYKSKPGHTEQYAKRLADDFPGCVVMSLQMLTKVKLEQFDMVIFDSRVYAVDTELQEFVAEHWDVLKTKKVCMFTDDTLIPVLKKELCPALAALEAYQIANKA